MKTIVFLLVAAVALSCAKEKPSEQAASSIDEAKTREVLDRHMIAFKANDIEAIMSDYTEESILIIPDETRRGLAEIRKGFEGAFAAFPKDSTTMTISKSIVAADVAYVIWQAKTPKFELPLATDTFIIRDGKIIRQTYASYTK